MHLPLAVVSSLLLAFGRAQLAENVRLVSNSFGGSVAFPTAGDTLSASYHVGYAFTVAAGADVGFTSVQISARASFSTLVFLDVRLYAAGTDTAPFVLDQRPAPYTVIVNITGTGGFAYYTLDITGLVARSSASRVWALVIGAVGNGQLTWGYQPSGQLPTSFSTGAVPSILGRAFAYNGNFFVPVIPFSAGFVRIDLFGVVSAVPVVSVLPTPSPAVPPTVSRTPVGTAISSKIPSPSRNSYPDGYGEIIFASPSDYIVSLNPPNAAVPPSAGMLGYAFQLPPSGLQKFVLDEFIFADLTRDPAAPAATPAPDSATDIRYNLSVWNVSAQGLPSAIICSGTLSSRPDGVISGTWNLGFLNCTLDPRVSLRYALTIAGTTPASWFGAGVPYAAPHGEKAASVLNPVWSQDGGNSWQVPDTQQVLMPLMKVWAVRKLVPASGGEIVLTTIYSGSTPFQIGYGVTMSRATGLGRGYAFRLNPGFDLELQTLTFGAQAAVGTFNTLAVSLFPASSEQQPYILEPFAFPYSRVTAEFVGAGDSINTIYTVNITGLVARSSVSLAWVLEFSAAGTSSFAMCLRYDTTTSFPRSFTPAISAVLGPSASYYGYYYYSIGDGQQVGFELFGTATKVPVVSVLPTPSPAMPPSPSRTPLATPSAPSPIFTPRSPPDSGSFNVELLKAFQSGTANAIVPAPSSLFYGYAFEIPQVSTTLSIYSVTVSIFQPRIFPIPPFRPVNATASLWRLDAPTGLPAALVCRVVITVSNDPTSSWPDGEFLNFRYIIGTSTPCLMSASASLRYALAISGGPSASSNASVFMKGFVPNPVVPNTEYARVLGTVVSSDGGESWSVPRPGSVVMPQFIVSINTLPSPSWTPSASISLTATNTATPSNSLSGTSTRTASRSFSGTVSVSYSGTSTATMSRSFSETRSVTGSFTPTRSSSATPQSLTSTPTATQSPASATNTRTSTVTATVTRTASSSVGSQITPTASGSAAPLSSPSSSPLVGVSSSATPAAKFAVKVSFSLRIVGVTRAVLPEGSAAWLNFTATVQRNSATMVGRVLGLTMLAASDFSVALSFASVQASARLLGVSGGRALQETLLVQVSFLANAEDSSGWSAALASALSTEAGVAMYFPDALAVLRNAVVSMSAGTLDPAAVSGALAGNPAVAPVVAPSAPPAPNSSPAPAGPGTGGAGSGAGGGSGNAESGPNIGLIVGAAVGGVVLIAAAAAGVVFWTKRRQQNSRRADRERALSMGMGVRSSRKTVLNTTMTSTVNPLADTGIVMTAKPSAGAPSPALVQFAGSSFRHSRANRVRLSLAPTEADQLSLAGAAQEQESPGM